MEQQLGGEDAWWYLADPCGVETGVQERTLFDIQDL